jgi:acetyl esterase
MALDRNAGRLLKMLSLAAVPDDGSMTPENMRDSFDRLAKIADLADVAIGNLTEALLPSPGGPIRTRIYTPLGVENDPLPAIVYFHGGGGIFCSLDTHEGLCRTLANASRCRLFSVDYRLAPEHKFPAAVDDCQFALRWIISHASDYGIEPARIAVGGDSAGATLAIASARMNYGAHLSPPKLLLLLCPVISLQAQTESRRLFASGYLYNSAFIDWMIDQCCARIQDLQDWRMSPMLAPSHEDLPPVHIHTAECDPFRDEGAQYAQLLRGAGVAVRYECHPGMIHHFYAMGRLIPYARTALLRIGEDISEALA